VTFDRAAFVVVGVVAPRLTQTLHSDFPVGAIPIRQRVQTPGTPSPFSTV
jgi:hypothetical protein